jgi:hypothetical protein
MKAFIAGAAVALVAAAVAMAAGQIAPPPGEYRIDSEAVTTSRAGPMTLRSTQRTDGATGTVSVEQAAPDGSTTRQTYPGGAPPPGAAACANRRFEAIAGGGSIQEAVGSSGHAISDAWRRLADGTWERRFETNPAPAAAPVDPRTAAAMAPVIAEIEATIRNGPPAEAEAARQQLAALKASLGGGGNDTKVEVRETWTRVSDRCG